MNFTRKLPGITIAILALTTAVASQTSSAKIENSELRIEASSKTGSYEIQQTSGPAHLIAGVAAKVNGRWLHSGDYPRHAVSSSPASASNDVPQLTLVNDGLTGQPELVCTLKLHSNPAYAEISVEIRNTTGRQLSAQGIRLIETRGADQLTLGGPESADRILSDSFSEDRPAMAIHDLGDNHDGL